MAKLSPRGVADYHAGVKRSAARILLGLLTLFVVLSGIVVLRLLPGRGGGLSDLRWRITHARNVADACEEMFDWLMASEISDSEQARILNCFVQDDDPRLVAAGLEMLADGFGGCALVADSVPRLAIFTDWFNSASMEEKMQHRTAAVRCYTWVTQHGPVRDPNNAAPPVADWPIPPDYDCWRWLVSATLERRWTTRVRVDQLVYRERPNWPAVRTRLDVLNELSWTDAARMPAPHPLSPTEIDQAVRPGRARLVRMLSDELADVRMAAGRILALAGDPVGVPALVEWMEREPRSAPLADEFMTRILGPDWRMACESGSATSQPGAGDGR